ncbi:MAG: glycosyltransferase family 9 protein [Pseudomonadota bacterium]
MNKLPPGRLLIICTRRIGDVLLVTPLIRTFKRHWPNTKIDLLVFEGTESILVANPDINAIISVAEHPTFFSHYRIIKKIFRAYTLAVSTQVGDKATLYAFFAARYRIGMLGDDKSRWWKSLLLSDAVEFDNVSTHTVLMNLRLAEILQLTPFPEIVLAWSKKDAEIVSQCIDIKNKNLAVLHVLPKFSYKEWVKQGWLHLANWLQQNGYTLVFTGDKTQEEKKIVSEILDQLHGAAINMVGCLSLNQLAFLLSYSKIYIGPDTVVTHMAAALGVPTVALFGPSNPVKWGPWPKAWSSTNPFILIGSQQRNNVYLIQGAGSCVPCFKEGCDSHINSRSRCLENLAVEQVITAVRLVTGTHVS